MPYKEEALAFLGITKWHELGYKGKGIKILSQEKIATDFDSSHTDRLKDVLCMTEPQKTKSNHGKDVMVNILVVAPECTPISYTWGGVFSSKGYKCSCAEYIKENKVHISTTSLLGGVPNEYGREALQDCIDAGCIFFGASGNKGVPDKDEGTEVYGEVRAEEYLAIGGAKPKVIKGGENPVYDWDKIERVTYSSSGPELDFVTLAEILGPHGTSFCSPVFAAMCGLVQQFFEENAGRRLTRDEMIQFVKDNSRDLQEEGFDNETGYGLFILPEPSTINISKYVPEYSTSYIDYGGMPKEEDVKIKQVLLTPSSYTRPQTKINPTAIAWHYVGNPNTSAINNRNYFESLKDTHETKASCHFIIGLGGEILQLIPEDEKSFCTNQANPYTISIECCHPDTSGKFTDATYKSMLWLGRYLMDKHNIKENIRHYDITGKACPKWFVDHPDEWEKFKSELEGDEDMPRYKTVEEMPEYYRKDIQELIDKGIIAGRGGDAGLDLSDDMCRMAIYAKKIFEKGGK